MAEKITRMEVIVGDAQSGLIHDIRKVTEAMESFKQFQYRLIGGFAAVSIVIQLLIEYSSHLEKLTKLDIIK